MEGLICLLAKIKQKPKSNDKNSLPRVVACLAPQATTGDKNSTAIFSNKTNESCLKTKPPAFEAVLEAVTPKVTPLHLKSVHMEL